ncbi:hypothetical protein [Kribbella italica]|uniref:Uncharacterized protein n=1 Tax=Kribbella italica TaxID=1540520 RepID=A0A7W9J232_9ACTN|nr:hypothetical protein [Kribbella italica]MBB5834251.1 hypothetical protein [Kribbella italica]
MSSPDDPTPPAAPPGSGEAPSAAQPGADAADAAATGRGPAGEAAIGGGPAGVAATGGGLAGEAATGGGAGGGAVTGGGRAISRGPAGAAVTDGGPVGEAAIGGAPAGAGATGGDPACEAATGGGAGGRAMTGGGPAGEAVTGGAAATGGGLVVPPRLRGALAAGACVVVALGAALAVDSRLDRHWATRGITLLLALACAAVLTVENGRRARRIIAVVGLLMFGFVFPVTSTTWSTPPEIDFALRVADDAQEAADKSAQSVVTVEDVRRAAEARGGAVGSLVTDKSPEARGSTAYPLIIRAHKDQGRPWACLTFENGLTAKVRAC